MGEIRVVWSNATKSASLPNIAHPTSTGLLWQSGTLILLLLLLLFIDLVKVIFLGAEEGLRDLRMSTSVLPESPPLSQLSHPSRCHCQKLCRVSPDSHNGSILSFLTLPLQAELQQSQTTQFLDS